MQRYKKINYTNVFCILIISCLCELPKQKGLLLYLAKPRVYLTPIVRGGIVLLHNMRDVRGKKS